MNSDTSDFDAHMMRVALRCAALGLGTTAPNPSVGAVIADEATGEIIASGTTAPGGRPHAEPLAIAVAGSAARGRTMYVTLEPCSHVGRTRPCADAILEAGLARVVVAQEDPDPRVSGRGLRKLREAGVAVSRGLFWEEARWLTRGHILRVAERRPFVQLKLAVDAAGAVPQGRDGRPTFVTSPQARARGHMLRARADAILVGAGTVRDDDPDLTCRLPGLAERSPVRIVLAGRTLPRPDCRLVRTARASPVWILATRATLANAPLVRTRLEDAGCRIFEVGSVGGRPWIPSVLETLIGEGITRVLVEGGPAMWQAFADAGFADEVVLFRAGAGSTSNSSGTDGGTDLASAGLSPELSASFARLKLRHADSRNAGGDAMTTFRAVG